MYKHQLLKYHLLFHTGEKPYHSSYIVYINIFYFISICQGSYILLGKIIVPKCIISIIIQIYISKGETLFHWILFRYKFYTQTYLNRGIFFILCYILVKLAFCCLFRIKNLPDIFECSECEYKCGYKHHLLKYLLFIHTGDKPFYNSFIVYINTFYCISICHFRIKRLPEIFDCSECEYIRYLKFHIYFHTREIPYYSRNSLYIHIFSNICKYYEYYINQGKLLMLICIVLNLILQVNSYKLDKLFQCLLIYSKFYTHYYLNRILCFISCFIIEKIDFYCLFIIKKIHKIFECSECEYNWYLECHIYFHTGEMPYKSSYILNNHKFSLKCNCHEYIFQLGKLILQKCIVLILIIQVDCYKFKKLFWYLLIQFKLYIHAYLNRFPFIILCFILEKIYFYCLFMIKKLPEIFECSECEYNRYLECHIYFHTGEMPYKNSYILDNYTFSLICKCHEYVLQLGKLILKNCFVLNQDKCIVLNLIIQANFYKDEKLLQCLLISFMYYTHTCLNRSLFILFFIFIFEYFKPFSIVKYYPYSVFLKTLVVFGIDLKLIYIFIHYLSNSYFQMFILKRAEIILYSPIDNHYKYKNSYVTSLHTS